MVGDTRVTKAFLSPMQRVTYTHTHVRVEEEEKSNPSKKRETDPVVIIPVTRILQIQLDNCKLRATSFREEVVVRAESSPLAFH